MDYFNNDNREEKDGFKGENTRSNSHFRSFKKVTFSVVLFVPLVPDEESVLWYEITGYT